MLEIRNSVGSKFTLIEYLNTLDKGMMIQIKSALFGNLITGTIDYATGHLDKQYFGGCVQGIDKSDYGIIIYVR